MCRQRERLDSLEDIESLMSMAKAERRRRLFSRSFIEDFAVL